MNRQDVQEVYNRVNTSRSIFAVEELGLKCCLFYDLLGIYSVENMSDTDAYFQVKQKIKDLCKYALNVEPKPVAKDFNGDDIYIGGTVWFDGIQHTVRAYEREGEYERILVTENDGCQIPLWLYIGDNDVTVRNPNGQSDSLESMRDAIQAVIDSLQKMSLIS